jgi:hypothetical protein
VLGAGYHPKESRNNQRKKKKKRRRRVRPEK